MPKKVGSDTGEFHSRLAEHVPHGKWYEGVVKSGLAQFPLSRLSMVLRLKFPPTPENASRHALVAVESVRNIEGVELDYSPQSLVALDGIIEKLRQDGATLEQIAETLFTFGCYVGEVFVRHAGGFWRAEEETPMRGLAGFMVVELPGTKFCNPIGKTFKRLRDGATENLPYFYAQFAESVL